MIDPGRRNLFTTVYVRGPMTLQALRNVMGDEAFTRLSTEWAQDPGSRSLEDWMAKAQSMTATDLQPLLARFLAEGRTAVVMEVSSHALELGRVAGTRFALSVDDGPPLKARAEAIFAARARNEWTVPTTIGLEKATNPFLRAPLLAERLGVNAEPAYAAFGAVRTAKDNFKG